MSSVITFITCLLLLNVPIFSFGSINLVSMKPARSTDTANVKSFGAMGDGKHDDTQPIIKAISTTAKVIFFPAGIYKISATIPLRSNKELVGESQKSVLRNTSAKEIIKTFGPKSYENITIKEIKIEGNVKEGEEKLVICMQFYNVKNINILSCSFNNASAAIGFQNCEDINIKGSTFNGMYQQPLTNKQYPGVYGYGIVLNECARALVEGNYLGTSTPHGYIMRHAVYISNSRNVNSISSSDITIQKNLIFLKNYTASKPLTGFEYVFKSIGGKNILITGNKASGGVGAVLLTYNFIDPINIKVENNHFNSLKRYGIFVNPEVEASKKCILYDLTVNNNTFIMNERQAQAFRVKNYKRLAVMNNNFINHYLNTDNKSIFLYIKKDDAITNDKSINIFNNKISGFKEMVLKDDLKDKVNLLLR